MALDRFKPAAEVSSTDVARNDLSDHDLIEATKQGDESAFAEIVQRYRNPIVNYLYRFLNDYEEAVDLGQETFVRVYFAIDRYHRGFAFSTYIYRIAFFFKDTETTEIYTLSLHDPLPTSRPA